MKKIITLAATACMITGCVGLKPDELVKADIPDNTIKTSTDSPKGTQPKEQDQEQEQNKNQGEQENKKGFFDAWTTGYYAGAAIGVIAAVGITAAVIYYKCRSKEIEKTYGIFARTKLNIRLTAQQIVDKLREGEITFNLKINSDISTEHGYLLRLFGRHSDIIAIFDRNKSSFIPGSPEFLGSIARIKNSEIAPNYPEELMEIKTRHIETLEIISDDPADTDFLNELIELVKGEEEGEEIVFSCVPSKISLEAR